VAEDLPAGFGVWLREPYFTREGAAEVRRVVEGQPQINAGLLVAPRDKMLALADAVTRLVQTPVFGPDQLVVNFVLHRDGWVSLPTGYNFVVATAQTPFEIDRGVFRFTDGRPIPVVHNAGNLKFLRPIDDFGWGPDRNHLKNDVWTTLRWVHQSNALLQTTRHRLKHWVAERAS